MLALGSGGLWMRLGASIARCCIFFISLLACASFALPGVASALIAIPHDPTFRAEYHGISIYNGYVGNTQPPSVTINGSDLTSTDQQWIIHQLVPEKGSDPTGKDVYVLERVDPDTGWLDGPPELGTNYAVAHVTFDRSATTTLNISFSMPAFGDPAMPSGTYDLLHVIVPFTKTVYDSTTDTDVESEFTDEDLGAYLSGDYDFNAAVEPDFYPAEFTYIAGAAKSSCASGCASNVLFLPGIEGSRLYMKDSFGENQLWEPGILTPLESDIQKLYLTIDGTSINSVYTKKGSVVDEYGLPPTDVYKTFLSNLAQLKASSTIADYLAFPYDWRMSPEDIVNKGTLYEDGTHYLDQELIALAATSKTGKVTIVAHSNGGLVAKALMEKLQQEGKADLVDKIILVDVPQIGTPQTIAALLHGDGESIDLFDVPGLLVSQANARGLGENMPDAYDLLPSAAYFSKVATPVVDLTLAPNLESGSGVGKTIDNSADLAKFLTTGRLKPAYDDIETPDLLSASLLDHADALHADLDSWTPPQGVQVIQIAGWGVDTPAGVVYQEEQTTDCSTFPCTTSSTTRHSVLFTDDGDNTVVAPSETAMSDEPTYYLNLSDAPGFTHATIMGMPAFEQLFASLLASSSPATLPANVSTTEPPPSASGKSLRLRVLSPVTLDAYDAQGRHTGMAPNPYPGSDLEFVEEQIPGSYYERYGEGQYIGLPANGDYKIFMRGTGEGTFTFEITPVAGGVAGPMISYANIPVTASTTATVQISANDPTSAELELDFNGDGKIDATLASSSEATDPLAYTKLIKSNIDSMDLDKAVTWQLDAKFTNVEFLLRGLNKWDNDDNDNDEAQMHGTGILHGIFQGLNNRFDSMRDKLIIQKLDKIEAYVEQEAKPQKQQLPTFGFMRQLFGRSRSENGESISPDQATEIMSMIEQLKILLSDN